MMHGSCDNCRHVYLPNSHRGATVVAFYRRGEGEDLRTVRAPVIGWRVDPTDPELHARPIVAGMPLDWAETYAVEQEGKFYFPDRTAKQASFAEVAAIDIIDEQDRLDQRDRDEVAARFAKIRGLVPAE